MEIKLRAYKGDESKRFIEGYASLFNVQSRLINEKQRLFREIIRTGAFDEVLEREDLNVIANIDHDMKQMLGRNVSGTLTLSIDNRGLKYVIEVPDTQAGNDIYEQVERGDYYESSFAYGAMEKDVEWSRDRNDGMLLRYVNKITVLRDVAIVRNGAFKNTDVSLRADDLDYIQSIIKNVQNGEVKLCQRSTSDFQESEMIEETVEEEVVVIPAQTEEEIAEQARADAEEGAKVIKEEVAKPEAVAEEVVAEEVVVDEANEETVKDEVATADAEADNEVVIENEDERSWEADNKKLFLEIKTIQE